MTTAADRVRRTRRFAGALGAAFAEFGRVFVKSQRTLLSDLDSLPLQEPLPPVRWPADVLEQCHPDDGGFE